ncbi:MULTISPECIES: 2-oxoacid:acceptor oxidoreductase subunit alpha [Mycolicibacterium]|uniref:2-oxoglutarate ferredoxin oxidoreductase subunit alpha n=3 Tax=Mycolicibacterium TaxID=1866885 RepID=A0A378T1J0_9MYCO|nr:MULTISPECIES: 2-oxoacid:acceptor oxidoreductase subunit alpha [Mycolicibacterium]KLI07245.1 2-oxoglutarate ferredoxin oxidoreductase subunit alpha [Mycolicibacterium senegalense]KLO48664.1 2-oxoglutarate ferredoxin oxidoreductase subunit alpha [Mycolicibacterium senegalense]KMV20188.1 2-oxoglutarate ferredoxin oxidoreductase subunit alpha [Mycolicibacterium conceptionense]MCV7338733.1 2-oxoacid:acceptor oxidoreductase subunit alpha [Mycolicibacterium senegalense]MCW1821567.1 2-oxoacid:accep
MGENGNGNGAAPRQKLEKVVIRFAGDSGDGMQLTGDRFTSEAALFGNDLATQPNYPAEIRAPQGTLPGVSSFQIQIADYDILTAGDRPDVLVAMNPAALKANVSDLPRGGLIIANSDEFTKRNLAKVGYDSNPLEDDTLSDYVVTSVAMTTLTLGAVEAIGATKKDGQRAKNMFALGLLSWMYGRELEHSEAFIREKFSRKPDVAEANVLALKAGWNYGETTEAFATTYEVSPAKLKSGEYRQISGNTALAYGIVAAGHLAQIQVVLGTYPITPASDILHELSKHKNFNVLTFQAEDEIAGIGAAIGASYGGALGVTSTSGPGVSLKSEAIGLAVMTELPLIIIDVQRGGPSTGLPTKTEQADLLQALFGRNGESPVAVLAPKSPSDCFDIAVEAARIAVDYHTPVIILSDGAVANGSEPWQIPDISSYPAIEHNFAKSGEPFAPYARDPETLARQFAVPGTPGLEHRIGGLEAANGSGNISYEPKNHDLMVRLRQEKIAGIAVPELEVDDPTGDAELLMLGWGSSYGPIGEACRRARRKGIKVAQAHLRHLNPFPANLGEVLRRYPKVVVPEMNLGQLALLLRGKYLVDVQSVTKVEGMAFLADEVEGIIDAALDGTLGEKEADKAKFARLAAATIEEPTENAVGANA